MQNKKTNRLALNQDTLRNLTPDQLREVAGRGTFFHIAPRASPVPNAIRPCGPTKNRRRM